MSCEEYSVCEVCGGHIYHDAATDEWHHWKRWEGHPARPPRGPRDPLGQSEPGTTERESSTMDASMNTVRASDELDSNAIADRALANAIADLETAPESFDTAQMSVEILALNSKRAGEWAERIDAVTARCTLDRLTQIADEHRYRAERAEILAGTIRNAFREAAAWNLPDTTPAGLR